MAENLIITSYASKPDSDTLMSTGYFAGTGANGVAYRFGYNNSIGVPAYIGAIYDSPTSSYSASFIAFTTSNLVLYYNEAWTGATTVSTFTANVSWSISGNAYKFTSIMGLPSDFPSFIPKFQTRNAMAEYYLNYIPPVSYPITYYPTNVTLDPAPAEAAVGDIITVGVSVPAGYTIRDPSSNIVVRNNGVIVPHTWDASSSRFTFTMPDPSQ